MGRPAKSLELLQGHLTKTQKAARSNAEKRVTTDLKPKRCQAVVRNKTASAYWKRLMQIYESIDICDAAIENVANRYCIMLAEHDEIMTLYQDACQRLSSLPELRENMETDAYMEMVNETAKCVTDLAASIRKIRDQLFAIEKENMLTAQSKLRAMPKTGKEADALTGIAAFRAARGE